MENPIKSDFFGGYHYLGKHPNINHVFFGGGLGLCHANAGQQYSSFHEYSGRKQKASYILGL